MPSKKKSRRSEQKTEAVGKSVGLSNTRKYCAQDLVATCASIGQAWVLTDVSQVAGGTDLVNRVGRRIFCKGARIGLSISGGQSNNVADDVYNTIRFVVVIASDTLIAADWATVLLRTPPIIGLWPKVRRFLVDKTYAISSYGLDSAGYIQRVIRREIAFQIAETLEFDGVNATDHSSNAIFAAMISDSAAVSHPGLVEPSLMWFGFSDLL
jgi:hypothetical protein